MSFESDELSRLRKIVYGTLLNLGRVPERQRMPRWGWIKETCGVGSTMAQALCREFAMDPDEVLPPLKRGGPETCPRPCGDCADRKHHWIERIPDLEDPEDHEPADHEAMAAGLAAYYVCKHCDAWIEDEEE